LGQRKLGFGGLVSTAAVRTHGDFGIIPSPYDIDGERKMPVNIAIKTDKLNTGYEYQKCELDCALREESFASRCETLLLHGRKSCIIKSIFAAGGRTAMAISYNKLWKLLVDKKMSKADLRKAAGIAPNTMTRLRRDEEVTLAVLNKSCSTLDVDIGDIMEFLPDPLE